MARTDKAKSATATVFSQHSSSTGDSISQHGFPRPTARAASHTDRVRTYPDVRSERNPPLIFDFDGSSRPRVTLCTCMQCNPTSDNIDRLTSLYRISVNSVRHRERWPSHSSKLGRRARTFAECWSKETGQLTPHRGRRRPDRGLWEKTALGSGRCGGSVG